MRPDLIAVGEVRGSCKGSLTPEGHSRSGQGSFRVLGLPGATRPERVAPKRSGRGPDWTCRVGFGNSTDTASKERIMERPAAWSFGATIPAKDLEGTRRFYEDILKCEVVQERPGFGIMYRSGDSLFGLYPTQFAGTAQHTLGGFAVDDVEAAVADLRARGVKFEQYDMPGLKTDANGIAEMEGQKGAWFKDPEGNILAVSDRSAM